MAKKIFAEVSKFIGKDPSKKPRVAAQNAADAAQAANKAQADELAKQTELDKAEASKQAGLAQDEAKRQASRNAISEQLRKEGSGEGRRRFLKGAK